MHRETFEIKFKHDCEVTIATPRAVDATSEEPIPADVPIVIALHGMGQNEDRMRRFMGPIADLPFIWVYPRGVHPFEIRKPEKTRIGHAWYLFTGDQETLRQSMLDTTEYLLEVRTEVINRYGLRPCAIVGFSQGGYLAGVVAANHADQFTAAASLGGRLKHEFMPEGGGVKLAQFHGAKDVNVSPDLAKEAAEATRSKGYEVEYSEDIDAGHEISEYMAQELGDWLKKVFA
ncbi:hypothetical protein OAU50_02360 [Planctomycetota bacterium]|nr:hypothetical protein [Planctomycetota bacterium]